MKTTRPLFLIRDDIDVDVAISAVMPIAASDCEPLILIQPARAHSWRAKYILDPWDCVDAELEAVRVKGQRIVQAFAARGVACEMDILHQDEPWRIRSIASRHSADMLITSRFPKARPNKHHTALAEADLVRSLNIPVCFAGTAYTHDRPVVGMLDLTKNTDEVSRNNEAVIETTFAMAVQDEAVSELVFMSYCPDEDTPVLQENMKTVRQEISENQKTASEIMWEDNADRKRVDAICGSMEIRVYGGTENELRETLVGIDPVTIVMGCPVRSALARCFNPGMTPILLGTDRTVLMTHHEFRDQESERLLPKAQQREGSDPMGRKMKTASLKI